VACEQAYIAGSKTQGRVVPAPCYILQNTEGYRRARFTKPQKRIPMNLGFSIAPVVSLIAGILILLVPRLLNYIVALYLIIIGILGLIGTH
jgi:hypothetical protein